MCILCSTEDGEIIYNDISICFIEIKETAKEKYFLHSVLSNYIYIYCKQLLGFFKSFPIGENYFPLCFFFQDEQILAA